MKIRLVFYAGVMVLGFFSLVRCATAPTVRSASEYLMVTDRPTGQMLKDVREKLEAIKYKVEKEDNEVGLLVLAPRGFAFSMDGVKTLAKQSVQIRQESGSVKLRIEYRCNYNHDRVTFEPCFSNDKGFESKVRRIEPALVKTIREQLMKHASQPEG